MPLLGFRLAARFFVVCGFFSRLCFNFYLLDVCLVSLFGLFFFCLVNVSCIARLLICSVWLVAVFLCLHGF